VGYEINPPPGQSWSLGPKPAAQIQSILNEFLIPQYLPDISAAMQISHDPQPVRTLNVVDTDNLEPSHGTASL
jgi:hypothetical protein